MDHLTWLEIENFSCCGYCLAGFTDKKHLDTSQVRVVSRQVGKLGRVEVGTAGPVQVTEHIQV